MPQDIGVLTWLLDQFLAVLTPAYGRLLPHSEWLFGLERVDARRAVVGRDIHPRISTGRDLRTLNGVARARGGERRIKAHPSLGSLHLHWRARRASDLRGVRVMVLMRDGAVRPGEAETEGDSNCRPPSGLRLVLRPACHEGPSIPR